MNNTEQAQERWCKYVLGHPESTVAQLRCLGGSLSPHPWMLIGWAHKELVRRGWSVGTTYGGFGFKGISVTIKRMDPGDDKRFGGSTLLGCHLDAIEATEKKT